MTVLNDCSPSYIGLLPLEDVIEILRYRMYVADRIVHSHLNQPVDILKVFAVL